jgi:Zn-finger nucleic acid-binding protein
MELSGRSPGYRGAAIRCPGCAEPMTQHALADCEVDLCAACGGIWVDWFDGDVRKVTTEARRAAPLAPTAGTAERPSRNEAMAMGACPRCTRQLAAERHAVDAVDGQTPSVELLRCEECMGVFVSETSGEQLGRLTAPPDLDLRAPASPLARFVETLRRLLGLGSS